MGLWQRLFGRKASEARSLLSLSHEGQTATTPANYSNISREAYAKNVVAFRSVAGISQTCSQIPWCLYQGEREVEGDHPLKTLLQRPNPMQGGAAFMESVVAFYCLAGNTYIEAVRPNDKSPPLELWPMRPDRVSIKIGTKGYPAAYIYKVDSMEKVFPVDPIRFSSNVLHMRTFNPLNDWYGMSCVEAAMLSLDQSNAVSRWNLSLLRNSAMPSGILKVDKSDSNPNGSISNEQFMRIKEEWSSTAPGQTRVIEGNLSWQQLGLSPKDMDWIESKQTTARDVALAFGYPPLLLNIPGDSTYSNYSEARLAFYEETIIPLMRRIRDDLNNWLTPAFGKGLHLEIDLDDVPALVEKRLSEYDKVNNLTFLTQNEKRTAVGFSMAPGWDIMLIDAGKTAVPLDQPELLYASEGAQDEGTEEETSTEEEVISEDVVGSSTKPKPTTSTQSAIASGVVLNGAQMTSMLELISQVSLGQIPADSAINALIQGFGMDYEEASAIITPAIDFEPEPLDGTESNTNNNTQEESPDVEEQDSTPVDDGSKAFRASSESSRRRAYSRQNTIKTQKERDFYRDMNRVLQRQADYISSSLNGTEHLEMQIDAAIKKTDKEVASVLHKHIEEIAKTFGFMVFDEGKASPVRFKQSLEHFVNTRTARSLSEIQGTSAKQAKRVVREAVLNGLKEGDSYAEISKAINSELTTLSPGRSMLIARTETQIASNTAALEAAKEVGAKKKTWLSSLDQRTRDSHALLNEASIPIDEKFVTINDATMDGPGDQSAPIEELANCRCVLVYEE